MCTVAALGAWTVGIASVAPAAVAADVQSKQWYLDAMKADEMWKVTTGEGVTVAVIDTGVNPSTSSLKGQVLEGGLDATDTPGEATDDYDGHGTTMAELIAGTGKGGGLKGLAPGAKILPMRISDTEYQNNRSVNGQDAEDAIRAAADSDAQDHQHVLRQRLREHQPERSGDIRPGQGQVVLRRCREQLRGRQRGAIPRRLS